MQRLKIIDDRLFWTTLFYNDIARLIQLDK